jgi:alkanesulfonate monooxygenase SsuD/methylene tetrahydromethanopterin reductase-like flavin-dependent oxidoreductase (luciferase family)
MIGAVALVTQRLRFVTTVSPAMRDPFSAAKAIGTAAVLAQGRLELGIGVGWCRRNSNCWVSSSTAGVSGPTRCWN